jgi:LPXTG-motif cell wall-anchored protein
MVEMKLTKKLLVGLVVLALMAGMALTAFAADPKLAINVGEANDKGEVKVDLILKNAAGLMDGAFYLKYDDAAYTFDKVSTGIDVRNSEETSFVTGTPKGTTMVTCAFAIAEKVVAVDDEDFPVNVDNFVLMTVTFKIKDAAKAKKAAFEAGTIDNEPIKVNDAKVNVAKVTLAPKEEETTTAPATTTTAPATTKPTTIPKTGLSSGDALASAAIATLAVAAAAFVVTKKKK